MLQKFVGILFIVIGLGVVFYLYQDDLAKKSTLLKAEQTQSIRNFSDMVSEDIYYMLKQKVMPVQATSVQNVVYNFHSALAQQLINNQKLKITEQPNGQYRMELDFIEVPDEKEPSIIVQYNLFDIKTNNKVWELGKTYSVTRFITKDSALKSPAK